MKNDSLFDSFQTEDL